MEHKMRIASCDTCAFAGILEKGDPMRIICLRHAPKPHEATMSGCVWLNEFAAWPKVQAKWRCGEWEER